METLGFLKAARRSAAFASIFDTDKRDLYLCQARIIGGAVAIGVGSGRRAGVERWGW